MTYIDERNEDKKYLQRVLNVSLKNHYHNDARKLSEDLQVLLGYYKVKHLADEFFANTFCENCEEKCDKSKEQLSMCKTFDKFMEDNWF